MISSSLSLVPIYARLRDSLSRQRFRVFLNPNMGGLSGSRPRRFAHGYTLIKSEIGLWVVGSRRVLTGGAGRMGSLLKNMRSIGETGAK